MSESNTESDSRNLDGLDLKELLAAGITSPDQTSDSIEFPELEGFEVIRLLGRGGMGAVFLARQLSLQRLVALKILSFPKGGSDPMLDRLEREAQAMARVSDPNTVSVFDFIRLPAGGAAIVMEYVEGTTLREKMSSPMQWEDAVKVALQVARSLESAHRAGVIHRDIKPENILVGRDGESKVTDFGLAFPVEQNVQRLTVTGTSLGTLGYMAQEQLEGGVVDERADVYSLGVVLYEMITGKKPFGNFDSPAAINPNVPQLLSDLTMEALLPEKEARLPDAKTMRNRLELTLVDFAELSEKKKNTVRSPLIFWTAATVLLLLLSYVFFSVVPNSNGQIQRLEQPVEISGSWDVNEGIYSSGSDICLLGLKSSAVESGSFDIEIEFTRRSGRHSVSVFFPHENGFGGIELSAWARNLGGLQVLDGVTLEQSPSAFVLDLQNGRRYSLLVRVRGDMVETYVDGKSYEVSHIGERQFRVSDPWGWQLGSGQADCDFVIGSYQSPTTFHSVQVKKAR